MLLKIVFQKPLVPVRTLVVPLPPAEPEAVPGKLAPAEPGEMYVMLLILSAASS